MRWALAVALITLAGCDYVLGLHSHTHDELLIDATPDSPIDAIPIDAPAPHVCLDRIPRPLFCADFDESSIMVYNNNIPSGFAPDTATATATLRSPSMTGPTALWIDSTHDQLFYIYGPSTTMVSKLEATFWLNVTAPAGGAAGIFRLTLSSAGTTCYFNLQVEPNPQRLWLNGFCPAPSESSSDIITPLPSGWVHIKFDFDRTPGVVSVTLNDDVAPTVSLSFTGVMGNVNPTFQLGLETGDANGFSVGYDDLEITGS